MPQAIEWSLATPMIRPRLPAIKPVSVIRFQSRRDARARSSVVALEDERGVGAAEAEAVRHDAGEAGVVLALPGDLHAFRRRVQPVDIRRGGDEVLDRKSTRPTSRH